MKTEHQTTTVSKVARLGSCDVEDQVRQAVACITLDGLQPSKYSIQLARSVAEGEISSEQAISALRDLYGRTP